MAYFFKGFRATKPVVRLLPNNRYQAFFVVYNSEGIKQQRRYSVGINILPVRERKKEAKALADTLWYALKTGWNPLVDKYPRFADQLPEITELPFCEALDRGLELKRSFISKSTFYEYNGAVRFFKAAAKAVELDGLNISVFERRHIKLIVNTAKQQRSWSSKARNKYLAHLKSLLSALVENEILDANPAHGIKAEPEEATIGYKRLTDLEQQLIASHILDKNPAFFEYIMFIYQCGIRRKELCMVQVKDVNILRRQVTIRPEVAKTNSERIVPLADDVYQVLINRSIATLPKDWYVFSADGFKAGAKPFHPNTPTSYWRRLVQEDLGIDCKMYSLKHKGADDKIYAGIDLDVLRTLYGHRSKQMTEVYAQAVRAQYAKTIMQQSPYFLSTKHDT